MPFYEQQQREGGTQQNTEEFVDLFPLIKSNLFYAEIYFNFLLLFLMISLLFSLLFL